VFETRISKADLLPQENTPKCTFWSHKLVQAVEGYFCIRNSNLKDRSGAAGKHSQDTFEAKTNTPHISPLDPESPRDPYINLSVARAWARAPKS